MGEDILIQGNIIAGKKSPINNVSNDIVFFKTNTYA